MQSIASRSSDLTPELVYYVEQDTRVEKIHVRQGETVKFGDLLCELANDDGRYCQYSQTEGVVSFLMMREGDTIPAESEYLRLSPS